jgi:hypothetical protein
VCASPIRYNHPPEAGPLKKLGRIAIWNREKIIFVTVMVIWMADIAFLVSGKSILQIMGECTVNLMISQLPYG